MKEGAIDLAYNSAIDNGYKGSKEDFFNLISKDENALNLSLNEAKANGFEGDVNRFKDILGINEIEAQEPSFTNGSMEQQEQPIEPLKEQQEQPTEPSSQSGIKTPDRPTPLITENLESKIPTEKLESLKFEPFKPKVKFNLSDEKSKLDFQQGELVKDIESINQLDSKLTSIKKVIESSKEEIDNKIKSNTDYQNTEEGIASISEYELLINQYEEEVTNRNKRVENAKSRENSLANYDSYLKYRQSKMDEDGYVEPDYFDSGVMKDALNFIREKTPVPFLAELIDDLGRSAAQGLAQSKTHDDALFLLFGNQMSDEQIDKYIKDVSYSESFPISDEMNSYNKAVNAENGSIWGVVKAIASNPGIAPQLTVNSIAQMLSPEALTAGASAGLATGATGVGLSVSIPVAMSVAGGVTSGAAMFTQLLKEELGDKEFNRENVKEILESESSMSIIRRKTAAYSSSMMAIEAIGGKLASNVGAKIVGNGVSSLQRKAASVATSSLIESGTGMLGEAGALISAGEELNASEIILEGIDPIFKGPIDVLAGVRDQNKEINKVRARFTKKFNEVVDFEIKKGTPVYRVNGSLVDKDVVVDLINNGSIDELNSAKIEVYNDRDIDGNTAKNKLSELYRKEEIKKAISVPGEVSDDLVNKIYELQKELDDIGGNTTEVAKAKASEIKSKISELIKEASTEAKTESESVEVKKADIEKRRQEEQVEMLEQIPNAEDFLTDGKVDRDKIDSEEGKAKFDEIYDRYDKLISPLLEDIDKKENIELSREIVDDEGNVYDMDAYDNAMEQGLIDNDLIEELESEEIRRAYEQRDAELLEVATQQMRDGSGDLFSFLAQNLGRIRKEDFDSYGDPKLRKGDKSFNVRFLSKNSMPLDVIVKELSEEYGMEITPQDAINYILDRQGNPDKYKSSKRKLEALNKASNIVMPTSGEAFNIYRNLDGSDASMKAIDDITGKVLSDEQAIIIKNYLKLKQNEKNSDSRTSESVQQSYDDSTKGRKRKEGSESPKPKKEVESASPEILSETDKKSIAEKVGNTRKVKPKNIRGLLDVMSNIFGLNKEQSEASAVVGDIMIENMAKRAGVSKDEMYQKIAFQKAQMKDLPKGIKFQVDAWHGSPHFFDKFTTEKMGTGEGQQAFGWGLYFTDSESIARHYAKALSKPKRYFEVNGIKVDNPIISSIIEDIYLSQNGGISFEIRDAKAILQDINERDGTRGLFLGKNLTEKQLKGAKIFLESYINGGKFKINEVVKNVPRVLYKVSLHKGKEVGEYTWLEWDKELTQDQLKNLVENDIDGSITEALENHYSENNDISTTKDLVDTMYNDSITGKILYKILEENIGENPSSKDASIALLRANIDGIKYPSESVSRGATSDTARGFNYVIFDEDAVSIDEVIKFQKDATGARGAMMIAMDNNATIYALTDPNVSTPLHELAHVYEHYLTDTERNEIESWSGHKAGTVEFSEAFARGFEKFLSEGKISNPRLKSIFEKFSGWLMDIYKGIKGSEIDVNLNDKMRSLYDNMLSSTPTVYKMHKDSEKSIKDKIKKMSIRGTTRLIREKLLDRQTRIKDLISGISSKEARKSIALLVTKAGASGYASFRFKQADKKIYNGLSKEDTVILDSIIYSRRISSINENRAKEGRDSYIGKDGYGKLEADNDLSLIELQLGVEKFLELSKRADEYFSEFDKSLKRMRDAKLISEEVYLNLKDYEYSPIKTIKYLIPEGVSSSDIDRVAITTGVTSDAIKKLSDSNDSDVIMDSRWLLMTNLSMVEGIVFENRLLNSFNDAIKSATEAEAEVIAEFVLDNPVVKKNEDGTTKRKYDSAPTPVGFKKVSFKTDGVDNYMVMRSDYANQLLDIKNKPGELSEFVSKLTLANVLRFFATSGNPLFIVGNTSVDFQNILFLSDTYSNNKLFGGFNLAFDFLKSVMGKTISTDKYKKSYEEFMVHGGSLDYLSSDGLRAIGSSLWSKYKVLDVGAKVLKGYAGFMAYLGETSEIGFRIAVFEKSKSNQIKEFKKDNKRDPNKDELEDIMFEAAREARETIDFNQGGTIVKSADKFGPYLNAATQGLRKAVDYSAKNPKQFASNMTQLALMSGTMFAASLFMLLRSIGEDEDEKELVIKTLNSISDFEKANYHILFNGKRDKNGEFKYFRFKKLPQTAVVSTIAEQLVLKAALKIKGIEYDPNLEVISKSFKAGLPVSPNPKDILQRNPLTSAFLTYHFNRDLFYDKEVFIGPRGKKIDPTAEGMFDPNVNQIYKDIAPAIGLSPIRSKAALEKIITSETTNPMIGLIYSGYDVAMRENTSMSKEIGVAMDNLINNSSKKIMRSTNSNLIKYKERAETDTQEMIIETEVYKKEQEVYNKIRESYQDGDTLSREDLRSIVEDKFDRLYWKKYLQKYSRYMENPDIDRSILDIIYEDTPEVQALKLFNRYGDGLKTNEDGKIDEEITDELRKAFKGTGRKIPGKTLVIYKEKYLD